ncbi:MAG TPA: deoxyribose-phosphate aldolase [Chloroflexi bacterium]|nr:deoxyribose-phosphate aldolase [Chloroflexota bacterium]
MESFRVPLVEFPQDALVEIARWLTPQRLASLIDVTDLKADTQEPKIHEMVHWAREHGFYSICVNPVEVDLLPRLLAGTGIRECYVIDFPLGKSTIAMKAHQAAQVVAQSRTLRGEGPGWVELDMVINVGRFKQDPEYTRREIASVVEAADGEHVKVIIRSSELTDEEIALACQIAKEAGAHFVKNSTGMEAFGATPDHIRLMRDAVGPDMGVKAAGGIRDALAVIRLIYAGALDPALRTPDRFRLGTSSPLGILSSLRDLQRDLETQIATPPVPCTICPSSHAEKLRPALREYHLRRCRQCPHRAHREGIVP